MLYACADSMFGCWTRNVSYKIIAHLGMASITPLLSSSTRVFVTGVECVDVFDALDTSRFSEPISTWKRQFNNLSGIAYDNQYDNVILCDSGNGRIQVFSVDGAFLYLVDVAFSHLQCLCNKRWFCLCLRHHQSEKQECRLDVVLLRCLLN